MSGDGPHTVVRPSIPPLAWMACGVWTGVVAAEAVAWRVYGASLPVLAAAVLPCAAACGVAVGLRTHRPVVTLALAGMLAGGVAGGLCWHAWRHEATGRPAGGAQTLVTAEDAAAGRFGTSMEGVMTDGAGLRRRVVVRYGLGEKPPELGSATLIGGSVKAVSHDERGRDLHRDGVVGTLSARTSRPVGWAPGVRGAIGRVRAWCVMRVRSVPGAAGALLSGVTLGDRRLLAGTPAEADFRTTGLTHLVAVSGSHLVVVAALVAWGVQRLRVRRAVSVVAVLAVMAGYVVATGMQASAIRALVMSGVAVGVVSGGRRTDRAAALAAAVVLALVVWPPVAFDLGFALSVASVAGLVVFARFGSVWLEVALPKRAVALAEPLSLTLVAQAATFGIAAPVFGVVSLVAPVANLLVGPLVAVTLTTGLAGLAIASVSRAAGEWVLHAAGAAAGLAVWIAQRLAALPAAAVPVGAWGGAAAFAIAGLALALWMMWPPPERARARVVCLAVVLLTVAAAVGPPARPGAEVVVLDVGQGDAILVRDGAQAALIDTGPDATALREALARQGTRDLEFVALTHAHDDHTGGSGALRGVHQVGAVLGSASDDPGDFADIARELRADALQLRAGQRVTVGSIALTVLWPRSPVPDAGENDASLVLLVQRAGRSVLLTGDAEGEVLDVLARAGSLPDVDVLKVGHHGSAVSLTPAALAALRPEVAVISVGEGNRFGHPRPEPLELLAEVGCVVRRTDLDGDVHVPLDAGGGR